MRLTIQKKLMVIFAAMASAFVIFVVSAEMLSAKISAQLGQIRDEYIPLMDLEAKISGSFENLKRGFQDAVAAQDSDALGATIDSKAHLFAKLVEAENIVAKKGLEKIREAVEAYCRSADALGRRMIAGETGTDILEEMTLMQGLQAEVENALHDIIYFDRSKVTQTISRMTELQGNNRKIRLGTGLACLILIMVLSVWIGGGIRRALGELSAGLNRFSQGDFGEPIRILNDDEIGDVARGANQMAMRIRGLMKELEAFSYSVAHDLRAPLRSVLGFSNVLVEDFSKDLPEDAKDAVGRIVGATKRMGHLIDSLLGLSRLTRKEMNKEKVDLSAMAAGILEELKKNHPDRGVQISVSAGLRAEGDPQLLHAALSNLLGNAWKYTARTAQPRIEIGEMRKNAETIFFIRDNGAGFDMQYIGKLFGTFQRLHTADEFEGTGIGLATVQSIVHRHGGRIWAEGEVNRGAIFYFTLG